MSEMIRRGKQYSTDDYIENIKLQSKSIIDFEEILKKYDIDIILTPSTASCAPKIGNSEKEDTGLIWTYLGLPALSVPQFFNEELGLPFGLQIVAPRYNDLNLLKFANTLSDY